MNVNDVKELDELPANLLDSIFEHQHSLATKYLPIEKANGLLVTDSIPVNIHDRKGQFRLKDMTWRVVEEIAEALEALDMDDTVHFQEELADAMHFLVEKCILAGFNPGYDGPFKIDLVDIFDAFPGVNGTGEAGTVHVYAMDYIKKAGLTCNTLKNKPWKQSHMMTDEKRFFELIGEEFCSFIRLCRAAGFDAESLYRMYMRKHTVNQFRQRSGY